MTPAEWMRALIERSQPRDVAPLPPAGPDQPGTLLRLPEALAEACGLSADAGLCLAAALDGERVLAFPARLRLSTPGAVQLGDSEDGALLIGGAASPYAFSEDPRSGAFLIHRDQPLTLPRAAIERLDLAARRAALLTQDQRAPSRPTRPDLRWRRLADALCAGARPPADAEDI